MSAASGWARWRDHWPEYLAEAFGLGFFMVSACGFAVLLFGAGSPVAARVPSMLLRGGLMGLAMGLTLVVNIYSPWGRRSGAHLNPAVTLTFLRLGRVAREDVAGYVAAQFAGGIAGTALAVLLFRPRVADPGVNYVATLPGAHGVGVAFLAEAIISFGLMLVVLSLSSRPRLAGMTGLVAGTMVSLYITFEAPFSGMSMNPARTLGSAVFAQEWTGLWLYFLAPLVGMLAAAELFRATGGLGRPGCAKFYHDLRVRCIFCGHDPRRPGTSAGSAAFSPVHAGRGAGTGPAPDTHPEETMRRMLAAVAVLVSLVGFTTAATFAPKAFTSKPFMGAKANTGTVTATVDGGKISLKVSDDFVIPDTPAPSWQVVDSKGNVYLLNQMKIKGGTNREITLPGYIKDVAKVQVWCSWAEALLGEAPFDTIVK